MDKNDFLELYKVFKIDAHDKYIDEWNAIMARWEEYRDHIMQEDGLPFNEWFSYTQEGTEIVENETIVKYIFNSRQKYDPEKPHLKGLSFFCSAVMYRQTAIRLYSNYDKETKQFKYYNGYNTDQCTKDAVENEYNNKIVPILKCAIEISNGELKSSPYNPAKPDFVTEISNFFKSNKVEEFANFQFFYGLFILESLREKSAFKNAFAWITAPENLGNLENLLFSEDENNKFDPTEKSFIERNHRVYERAIKWGGLDPISADKEDLYRLNKLLWYMANDNDLFTDLLNPNIIFSGAPATGKTYTVEKEIKKLQASNPDKFPNEPSPKFTQFHPSYTYQDFIEGIKPSGCDENGNLKLEVMNGSFKQFCIDVRKRNEAFWKSIVNNDGTPLNKDDPKTWEDWPQYYYVVDEINRGNLSNIFGETFTLLEYRDFDFGGNYLESNNSLKETVLSTVIRNLSDKNKKELLTYKELKDGSIVFGIPFNIHFVGMMNDVDRSIDAFDLAFRRRFKWIPTYCDYDVIRYNCNLKDKAEEYVNSCKLLNYLITGDSVDKPDKVPSNPKTQNLGRTFQIGHGYFLKIKNINTKGKLKNRKITLFENYIQGTLKEYLIQNIGEGRETEDFLKELKKQFAETIE